MMDKPATGITRELIDWLGQRGEVSWVHNLPAREPRFVPLPEGIDSRISSALAARGIDKLYSHQAASYRIAREGKSFVVVTPTASGKTLCYNLPVLQTLLEDPKARALYLFPTKALSQDQRSELGEISLDGSLPVGIHVYDGDTPSSLRTQARTSGRIVISNPDMLHSGILPNHPKWITFFSGLAYIVVDEMHSYRGVFGSHVGNVLKRLKRIAAFYGAHPTFIFCSATIGNPAGLAQALIEEEVECIDENGSGSGAKTIVFYNPPVCDAARGLRKSSALESQQIALELLKRGIKTILFARSRLQVELLASYLSSALENPYNDNSRIRVSPYRSGLLPSERRAIERGLREGSIQGVVSTNALELGIDIGGLDAAVIAGYPGSTASFWQQSGRAGRRGGSSLAVFVASSAPLDQYLSRHDDYFLSQAPESARIDPENPFIFVDHMKCAAFELPFSSPPRFGSSETSSTQDALELLEEQGIVRLAEGTWYWSGEGYPSEGISLRSATADNVVIVDESAGSGKPIGEMDRPSAKELIFDNAVYIHLGNKFVVKKLDIENRICRVVKANVDYWTDAVVKTDLKVLAEDDLCSVDAGGSLRYTRALGDVLVRSQAEKFKKLSFLTHENIGYGDISLPPEEMHTRSVALVFPEASLGGAYLRKLDMATQAAALVGASRLLKALAPVFALCDPRDLGSVARVRDPHYDLPALFLFDKYPGGTGLAEGIASRMDEVLAAARDRVSLCNCAGGCPSCVGADLSEETQGVVPGSKVRPGSPSLKGQVSGFLGACLGLSW